ncbi:TrbI/VirB10 family protein [Qipengyuania nanhaisediminis]|uniref:TrbI/VirB10 family protein n=1 Tax=Qipengyuania nanhaisediminis TaxID=604088 RepID=UPI0038B2F209
MMRLAMRLPSGNASEARAHDPRESEPAEIIELASRSSISAVAERRTRFEGLGLAAGVALVCLLGATTYWAMTMPELPAEQSVGSAQPPGEQASTEIVDAPPPAPQAAIAPTPLADPAPAPVYANPPAVLSANPYASPTMIYDASRGLRSAPGAATAPGALAGTGAASIAGVNGTGQGGIGGSAADFASRVGGIGGAPAQARAMVNPATTVTEGTMIPAILETAIDTDVPGYVRAMVSQDVRSFDGTTVLIPRSSRLIGQYQSGVQQGQKRAHVIWTRLIRPDGASVNIASPAVGFDGTTGLAGEVDNHFFRRFGSAMMLSVIGGLGAVASGGTSVVLGGAGQSAASVAAQQDSQIGPTIRVRMGEPIRVFTARDLDFSKVAE